MLYTESIGLKWGGGDWAWILTPSFPDGRPVAAPLTPEAWSLPLLNGIITHPAEQVGLEKKITKGRCCDLFGG